ncbi:hypothetical protein ACHQM5_018307 [Ranunculus cassubicifolius]
MEKKVEGTPRRTRLQLRREKGQTVEPKDTSAVPVTAEQMAVVTTTKSKLPRLTKSDKEAKRRYIQVEASSSRSETPASPDADVNIDEFDNSQSDTYIEASDTYIEASDSDEITTEIKQLKTIKDEDNNAHKEAHRCRIDLLLKLLHELRSRLVDSTGKSKLPSNVPFASLFNSVLEGPDTLHEVSYRKSTIAVNMILASYNQERDAFQIGEKWVPFTPTDIAVLLGLPMTGEIKEIFSRDTTKSSLMNTYFQGVKNISRGTIEEAIRTLAAKEDIKLDDITKLLVLYLACTFLFPNSNMYIGKSFLNHLESLEILSRVNWPVTLHKDMMNRIRQNINTPLKMTGSVILLLFWLCEHTSLGEKIDGRHNAEPRALRWNISGIGSKLDKLEISAKQLAIYPSNQVTVELKALSEEEQKLITVNSGESSIDVPRLIQENKHLKQKNAQLEQKVKQITMERNSLSHFLEELTRDGNFDFSGYEEQLSSLRSLHANANNDEDRRSLESCRSPIRNLQMQLAQEQVDPAFPEFESQEDLQHQMVLQEALEENIQFVEEVEETMIRTEKMPDQPRLAWLNTEVAENEINEGSPLSQLKMAESGSSHIQVVQENDEDDIPIAVLKKRKSPVNSMVQKIKARGNRKPKYNSSEWQKQQRKKQKMSDKNKVNEDAMIIGNEVEVENRLQNSPDSLPLHDITTSPNWNYIGEGLKDYMKRFFQTSNTSTIAWKDIDSDLEIDAQCIQDLMEEKPLDHRVLDFFGIDITRVSYAEEKFIIFNANLPMAIEDGCQNIVQVDLINKLRTMKPETEFLFFPININEKRVPGKWTLLAMDLTDYAWYYYNPMAPQSRGKKTVLTGKLMKKVNEELKIATSNLGLRGIKTSEKLNHMDCPKQAANATNSGLYVCLCIEDVIRGWKMQFTERKLHDCLPTLRANITLAILSELFEAWNSED